MTDSYIRENVKHIETYPCMNERIKEMLSLQGSSFIDLYVVKRLIELEDEVKQLRDTYLYNK